VSLLLDPAESGCFFKIVRAGLKLEFMCPTAHECATWLAALEGVGLQKEGSVFLDTVQQRLRYTDLEESSHKLTPEGRVRLVCMTRPVLICVFVYMCMF